MNINEKIGLSVITFDRPDYLKRVIERLEASNWGGATARYVIVDELYDESKYSWLGAFSGIDIIYQENAGVGKAKNLALKKMLAGDCQHLFLLEDDILIKSRDVCNQYISYAIETDVPHLNFALHGELNKNKKRVVDWKRNARITSICVYPNCVGAFSYYRRDVLEDLGLIDENFKNAWEHVEHTFRMCNAKKIPPFWYFMDHPESNILLEEIESSIENSRIRLDPRWAEKVNEGIAYWVKKHGSFLPPPPEKW